MAFPPQAPTSLGMYPQSLQIKLYQAFIFSVPILLSIILFLLFYFFYLKRRASAVSSHQPTLPIGSFNQSLFTSSSDMDLKGGKLKEYKFPTILFSEDTRMRDSTCCVCLGEFEMKEELHQMPACKHVFHAVCIRYWLRSNPTCPLCRCFIVATSSSSPSGHHDQHSQLAVGVGPNLDNQMINPHMVNSPEQLEVRVISEGGHG